MITINDIIYTKEIINKKISNTPSEKELKNIKELLSKCIKPLEIKWNEYCLLNNIGIGGITIKRGFISKDNYKLFENNRYLDYQSGFSISIIPSNNNIKEFITFLKKYFKRKNYDRIIELNSKNGIPDSIYISYKNQNLEQNKQYFNLI